jgi:hypothetical protein
MALLLVLMTFDASMRFSDISQINDMHVLYAMRPCASNNNVHVSIEARCQFCSQQPIAAYRRFAMVIILLYQLPYDDLWSCE